MTRPVWAKWHEASSHASYDVEQTGYPVSLWRVCLPRLKERWSHQSQGLSQWKSNYIKANGRYFTVVLVIADCWHRPIAKSTAHWSPMVPPIYKARLCHGPWRDPVRAHDNPYMCGAMWNVEHSLAMVSLNIYKPTQMNKIRKIW